MKIDAADPLLVEVLREDHGFRSATRNQLRKLAARKRRFRAVRRMGGVAALLGVMALVMARQPPVMIPERSVASVAIIRSAPLARGERVRTRTELFASIRSAPQGLAMVANQPADFGLVETHPTELEYLDDRQLLAAFPLQRPVLIEAGTDAARLVFY